MNPRDDHLDPEEIAATTARVRELAQRLVRDGADAEDVVQEAWLVALEGARPAEVPLRWWLAGIARNLAHRFLRGERRRQHRERSAARAESVAGDASAAAGRAEAQRRIAAAVLVLDAPYREVILLRYFEGLTPAEIAGRRGVRAGTVRMQLQRGLALLRGHLDRESNGGRRSWAIALLPLVTLRRTASAGQFAGGIAVKTSTKAAAAALVLAFAGGAWWATSRDTTSSGDARIARTPANPVVAKASRATLSADVTPTEAASAATPSAALRVTVRDGRGAVPGATVSVWSGFPAYVLDPVDEPPTPVGSASTADDGVASVAGLPPSADIAVLAEAPGHARAMIRVQTPPAGGTADIDVLLRAAYRFRGIVRTPEGVAIAGATVQIGTGWPWRTTTAADGRFELADLPWGTHELRAAHAGMVPLRAADVVLPFDGEIPLVLLPAASLAGTVREAGTGRPLAGARVTAGIWWGRAGAGEAVTDSDGRYVIETLPEGVVNQLSASLAGYYCAPPAPGAFSLQIGVFAGRTTERDLELLPARKGDGTLGDARLEGVVRGPAGPVAGADVRAQGLAGQLRTRTGTGGAYAFAAIPPGSWALSVTAYDQGLIDLEAVRAFERRDWSRATVEVAPASIVVRDLVLSAGVAIVGRVIDPGGAAVPGARFGTAVCGPDGRFRVAGVVPGSRETWPVAADGFVKSMHTVTAPEEGESEEVVICLRRCGVVRGTVRTGDGRPVPPAIEIRVVARTGLTLAGPSGAPDVRASEPVVPDAAGAFVASVPWAGSGSFVVEAEAPGRPHCVSAPVAISGEHDEYTVDLVLGTGIDIMGRVVDDTTGVGVAGAVVAAGESRADVARAVSDMEGAFLLRGIAAAAPRAAVHVRAAGYVPWSATVESGAPGPIEARLVRAAELRGHVVGEDGHPVAGVRVAFGSPQGRACVTDHTGAFLLRDLSPDPSPVYLSPASREGHTIRSDVVPDVRPGTDGLVFVVHPGLRIAGRVLLPNGAGAADVAVTARPTGAPRGAGAVHATTSGNGAFVLSGLAAGAWDLEATPNRDSPYAGDSVACFPARAEGVSAGAIGLVLQLTRGLSIAGTVADAAGRPLGGVWLEAGGRSTRSAPDGRFEISGLPPGRYTVSTSTSVDSEAPVQVTGGEDIAAGVADVVLVGIRGADLTGQVVGEDGAPVAGARIDVTGTGRLRRSATSGPDGTFRVANLPPASVVIRIDAPDRVPVQLRDVVPTGGMRIVLAAGATTSGVLLRADGSPLGETWINFVVDGEDHMRREARTDAEGRFRVTGLARREYRAIALVRADGDVRRTDVGSVFGGAERVRLNPR